MEGGSLTLEPSMFTTTVPGLLLFSSQDPQFSNKNRPQSQNMLSSECLKKHKLIYKYKIQLQFNLSRQFAYQEIAVQS